jgi:hypothetical protein
MRLRCLALLLLCSLAFGQGLRPFGIAPAASGGHSLTADFGTPWFTTLEDTSDSGNQDYAFAEPFFTPAGATNISLTGSPMCGMGVYGGASNAQWGCGIWTDSGSNAPQTLVCAASATNTPTNGVWNSLSMTINGTGTYNCSSTLPANTKFWAVMWSDSSTLEEGRPGTADGVGTCGNSGEFDSYSNNTIAPASWPPQTFPATTQNTVGCHSTYVKLSWTSTNIYDIVNFYEGYTQYTFSAANFVFPPDAFTTPGNALISAVYYLTSNNPITAFKDSNGNSLTQAGTCYTSGGIACIYYELNVASGTDGVVLTQTNGGGDARACVETLEVYGLKTSGSLDQTSMGNGGGSGGNFTFGPTGTTSQANEFAVGVAVNNTSQGSIELGTWTASGWTLTYQDVAVAAGDTDAGCGLFTKLLTSTGTLSFSGNWSLNSGNNYYGGIATFE